MKKFILILSATLLTGFLFSQVQEVIKPEKIIIEENIKTYDFFKTNHDKTFKTYVGLTNTIFADWHDDYIVDQIDMGWMPVGWAILSGNQDTQQSTDAHTGSYAMRIENGYYTNPDLGYDNELIRGYAFASQDYFFGGGQFKPYTERPISMTFWMKGQLLNNDTAIVAFQMFDGSNDFVGFVTGLIGPGALNPNTYNEFTMTFNYQQEIDPTKATLMVTSSGVGVFQGQDIGTLTDGSYIIIDNISYLMEEPSNVELSDVVNVSVYPNPASNILTVTNANNTEISILNILGKEVAKVNNSSANQKINISHLPSGTYFVRVDSKVFKINVVK